MGNPTILHALGGMQAVGRCGHPLLVCDDGIVGNCQWSVIVPLLNTLGYLSVHLPVTIHGDG